MAATSQQTTLLLGKIAAQRIPLVIAKNECAFIRKCGNYAIFGGGYLLSDEAARRADEAQRQADEARRQADEARRRADEAARQADDARQVDIPMDWRTQELLRQLNAAPTANSKLPKIN